MPVQIFGLARRAVSREIVRRRHDQPARLSELARGQRAVGQGAETYRDIGLAGGDIDQRVALIELAPPAAGAAGMAASAAMVEGR